ncbi:MAG: AsmA-like C-terminal region-containing protein [Terriglobales bacterium]
MPAFTSNPVWRYVLWIVAAVIVALGVGLYAAGTRLTPIVRNRALDMLRSRFDSEAEIGDLQVSALHGISVSGKALVLRHHGRTDVPPLIEIREFSGHMGWLSLVEKPWHIQRVELKGLTIRIPPKEKRQFEAKQKHRDIPVIVDELVSDDGELDLMPSNPEKPIHQFLIHNLLMHSVGLGHSAPFKASLTNAVPPGEITTEGHFGPWQVEAPGQTPLSTKYTFKSADLGVFHGIAGILSSEGKFGGVLEDIDVNGETTTPDFSLSIAGHPLMLKTDFQATVDGTNGDTLLHPVVAQFLNTMLVCTGGVVKAFRGPGREIVLDVKTDHARLEDLLRLAVKGDRPPMTGAVRLATKFDLPPGPGEIVDRLRLDGKFGIGAAEFTDAGIRQKLENLSRRGQGKPKDEDAGSAVSELKGSFLLKEGQISFRNLTFAVTGATVELAGTYGLRDEKLDFHGTLRLQAKLSEATTGFKSFFLKAFDPFFRKNGVTVLPIKVTGTRDQPSFSLDFHHKKDEGNNEVGD